MASSEYIVEFRGVTKKFPGITANDDISIGIRRGEIFALLGENGAGKSTLMSMLYGMYEPDAGDIFIRGERVALSSPSAATALGIGMVHQHFRLVPSYTIAENIVLGMEPVKKAAELFPYVDIGAASKRIRDLSKTYGLEVDPALRIEQVGVSTQQRVEILKMLYRDAEILIFDEPTSVLTPREIEFLMDVMRGLRESGRTIVLITHKLEEIKSIADRVAVLRRGKLAAILPASASAQEMADLTVGRPVSLSPSSSSLRARFRDVVLQVENLSVRGENGLDAVKGVSFSIRGGEIFAIAGVSGNGQIELADAIAGLVPPCGGRILLNGRNVTSDGVGRRTEAGVSYIPEDRQRYGLVLDFTVAENLAIKKYRRAPYSKSGILNRSAFRTEAEAMIARYDIRASGGAGTIARFMSGGNQQKTIIARELSTDSSLMIFVQPTRGLDVGAIENIHRRMLGERDKGRAILLVSLELDEVMGLADTIGVLYGGRLLKIFPADRTTVGEVGEYMMGAAS
ncbi:MAG: ABC transporter ATP-binding protein [Synergistaceae bacterium]|jgi:simple sugar transport system ATP-binding protein|nr:ABC transporter ATP-binding protein [Synergistaceae bacterium]